MRSTQEHRDFVVAGIENGRSHMNMQMDLMAQGLSRAQSNSVVRNQRKRLKVWNLKKDEPGEANLNDEGDEKRWGDVY
jgi:hypothetical protein